MRIKDKKFLVEWMKWNISKSFDWKGFNPGTDRKQFKTVWGTLTGTQQHKVIWKFDTVHQFIDALIFSLPNVMKAVLTVLREDVSDVRSRN